MKRLLSSFCIVVFIIMQALFLTGCPEKSEETADATSAQTELNAAEEYTILHSPFADGEEWYMTQAFGAYYDTCRGNHTGEDWNKENDAGAEIYPIAAGTVIDSGPVSKSISEYGYYVIIKHTGLFKIPASSGPHLSSDVDLSFLNGLGSYGSAKWFVNSEDVFTTNLLYDYSFYKEAGYQYNGGDDINTIYSVYLHLSSEIPKGTKYTNVSTPIGTLAPDTDNHPAHLHLEIRVGETDDEVIGCVLAGANKYGYYADSQEMADAGYSEPSSIIQANSRQECVLGESAEDDAAEESALANEGNETIETTDMLATRSDSQRRTLNIFLSNFSEVNFCVCADERKYAYDQVNSTERMNLLVNFGNVHILYNGGAELEDGFWRIKLDDFLGVLNRYFYKLSLTTEDLENYINSTEDGWLSTDGTYLLWPESAGYGITSFSQAERMKMNSNGTYDVNISIYGLTWEGPDEDAEMPNYAYDPYESWSESETTAFKKIGEAEATIIDYNYNGKDTYQLVSYHIVSLEQG